MYTINRFRDAANACFQWAFITTILVAAGGAHAQADLGRLKAEAQTLIGAQIGSLESLYQDLHAAPELAFQEVKTSARLASEMRALGFEVTEKIGKTGIVAILKNGPGPTILVRTELDALPMEEKTGLPYASKVKANFDGRDTFVMHSCAHDLHMVSWVGTARVLASMKNRWSGTLMFIGQPAEETVSGAKAMVADGLFTRFAKPDLAFALHTSPGPIATFGVTPGATTSNSDSLEIRFKGRGGHGSAPDKTIDPIVIASRFVLEVQSVVSREKDPMEFGVVTIGAFQAGSVGNIIPDTVTLRGTIRSYKPEVRRKLLDGVRRTAMAAAAMGGAPEPEVMLTDGGAAVMNDLAVLGRAESVLKMAFGDGAVARRQPITASEDFSEFLNAGVPGIMFFMGVTDPQIFADALKPGGKPLAFNHSPFFAPVPEPSIRAGALAMSLIVLQAMQPK